MRLALKVAYDGTKFCGYQRQPGVRTVEGDIIRGLKKARIIGNVNESRFGSASRTDRGVSALGNVIAFDTYFRMEQVIPALNAHLRDIWSLALAEIPKNFHPRNAKGRWYRYHLDKDLDVKRLMKAKRLFEGPHDFSSFAKKADKVRIRLDSIEIVRTDNFLALDFRAKSFVWNMIRRIVSAVQKNYSGAVGLEEISLALRGKRIDFGIAPPEPLFLMDVLYDFDFQVDSNAAQDVSQVLIGKLREASLKREFFQRALENLRKENSS